MGYTWSKVYIKLGVRYIQISGTYTEYGINRVRSEVYIEDCSIYRGVEYTQRN